MLLVITGAGASFDSDSGRPAAKPDLTGQHENWRPPLAVELFAPRPNFGRVLTQFDSATPLVAHLRRAVQQDDALIERELEKYQEEASTDERRPVQLAALKFYLQHVVWECTREWLSSAYGVTNYVALVDTIEHWRRIHDERVLYVSFNYDTLLEAAIAVAVGVPMGESVASYIADEHTRLVKPHGSVNWGRVVHAAADGDPQRMMVARAAALPVTESFEILQQPGAVQGETGLLFPALAIPVEKKQIFECPAAHLSAAQQWLPDVSRVLVIGWRATEGHFLELLRLARSVQRVAIVAGNKERADETASQLRRVLPDAGYMPLGHTFTSFIGSEQMRAAID